jgi:3-deoxy-D-manno-octulosonic-acid transferase
VLLSAYRAASWLASPLIGLYLRRRLGKGREHPERFGERFGYPGTERPPGELLWCHAASVGEAISVIPLLERYQAAHPDWTVLLTTGTLTSAALVASRAIPGLIHQFVPVDRPDAVARFLDFWQPSVALWVESELWPNLVRETRRRGVPMGLINARMSARSFKNWQRWPGAIRHLLGCFDGVLAQSAEDAKRLMQLGAGQVVTLGNLKSAAPPLPVDDKELRSLRAIIGDRPCWLAASVHPEEVEDIVVVQRYLNLQWPDCLTIIVPRHPERGAEWAQMYFDKADVRLRSKGDWPDGKVYIADTLGELGLFYRLAPVSFVGGSFAPLGGHNPLEPARVGSAILFGPHQFNFQDVSDALRSAGAAEEVEDAPALASAIMALRKEPRLRSTMTEAAARVAAAETAVLDHVLAGVEKLALGGKAASGEKTTIANNARS